MKTGILITAQSRGTVDTPYSLVLQKLVLPGYVTAFVSNERNFNFTAGLYLF